MATHGVVTSRSLAETKRNGVAKTEKKVRRKPARKSTSDKLANPTPGERSSARLKKMTGKTRVERATRRAADLGLTSDCIGDPSKKLLFMLNLGLMPVPGKPAAPFVVIKPLSLTGKYKNVETISLETPTKEQSSPPLPSPCPKDNVADLPVRPSSLLSKATAQQKSERVLQANQDANKLTKTLKAYPKPVVELVRLKIPNVSHQAIREMPKKPINVPRSVEGPLSPALVVSPFPKPEGAPESKEVVVVDLSDSEDEVVYIGETRLSKKSNSVVKVAC